VDHHSCDRRIRLFSTYNPRATSTIRLTDRSILRGLGQKDVEVTPTRLAILDRFEEVSVVRLEPVGFLSRVHCGFDDVVR
jgi:hypothetical protein